MFIIKREIYDTLIRESESLRKRVDTLQDLLDESGIKYVDNFFKDCPCCQEEPKKILLSKAKSFRKIEKIISFALLRSYTKWETYYTTENSYKLHEKKIKEWEAEKI